MIIHFFFIFIFSNYVFYSILLNISYHHKKIKIKSSICSAYCLNFSYFRKKSKPILLLFKYKGRKTLIMMVIFIILFFIKIFIQSIYFYLYYSFSFIFSLCFISSLVILFFMILIIIFILSVFKFLLLYSFISFLFLLFHFLIKFSLDYKFFTSWLIFFINSKSTLSFLISSSFHKKLLILPALASNVVIIIQ